MLFLTAAIAETKRTPFDIPEGEPEIIGYFVEYSGLRFGMFFLGEFIEIVFSSALMITIFFGGWRLPFEAQLASNVPNILFVLLGFGWWITKVFVFCGFQLLVRWSLPRFRPDQLMQLGWQRLLPVSIANVVIAAGWILFTTSYTRRTEETPMAVGVKVVARPGSLSQQVYLPAIAEGLGVTFRHFVKNFIGNVTGNRDKTEIVTIEYPEQKKQYPERHRGLHRLMLRDDGQVRCVACMMCPTVCPAHCITIVPEEAPDGTIEKRPKIFEIDELRCVVCGLCAEACPCDAIRMDTLEHAKPTYRRVDGDPRQGRADVARDQLQCGAGWGGWFLARKNRRSESGVARG